MNKNIMVAVGEIETVVDVLEKEYTSGDYLDQEIPQERAISDREKMIAILRDFYCHQKIDDFVTLFAVYCNHYIRFNLHQRLEEEDFGISALSDTITDKKLQDYLSLIQQGISWQNLEFFRQAVDLLPEYALPYLYLFIEVAIANNNGDLAIAEEMSLYFRHLDKGLQQYVLGESTVLRTSHNPAVDINPLPYIHSVDATQDRIVSIVRAMMPHYESLKDAIDQRQFDLRNREHQLGLESMVKKLDALDSMYKKSREWIPWQKADDKSRNSNAVAHRLYYLGIPCTLDVQGNELRSTMHVTELKCKLEKAIQQKTAIIRDFSHTYKNMKATTLKDIAQTLLQKEEEAYKNMGRTLLLEYGRKEALTKDIYMMQLKFEQQSEKLCDLLRNSRAAAWEEHDAVGDILHNALLLCFLRIFYDGYNKEAKVIRNHLKELWPKLTPLMKTFEDEVVFQGKDCLEWMKRSGVQFASSVSGLWPQVYLQKEEYGSIFFRNVFAELFINAMKYGDLTQPIQLELATSTDGLLCIQITNTVKPDVISTSGIGLDSMNEMLKLLSADDADCRVEERFVWQDHRDGCFTTRIALRADLFIPEGGKV